MIPALTGIISIWFCRKLEFIRNANKHAAYNGMNPNELNYETRIYPLSAFRPEIS